MLLIKAKGGLGNRILSAASFILYAQMTERLFKIDWRDGIYADHHQNAYDFLFENVFDNCLEQLDSYNDDTAPEIWKGRVDASPSEMIQSYFPSQHSNPWIYRQLCAPLTIKAKNQLEIVWSYTSKQGRIKRFINADEKSLKVLNKRILSQYFQPNEVVKKKVDELFVGLSNPILGVHIRYTDLKVSYAEIFKTIEKCFKKKSYKKIFLSTDNQEIEEIMKQQFGDVFTINKRFAKNSQQLHSPNNVKFKCSDAEFALIDLFALSRCEDMVYSSSSSFSRLGILMGDFKGGNLFDIDRFNLKTQAKNFIQTYI